MNRKTRLIPAWPILSAILIAAIGGIGVASPRVGDHAVPQALDTNTLIDVNNIAMFVTNSGGFARDLESPGGPSGLFFPNGTDKTAVYAGGLWIGAKVGGATRVTVAEYSLEYKPGKILANGQPDDPAAGKYRVYKVNAGDTTSEDYVNWPAEDGAPVDDQGNPAILGDQMLWAVYNDADPAGHNNNAGNSAPLGIEIQQSTFAFNKKGPLGNMVFLKFKIINKGSNVLEDTYVSLWSDPDLGGAGDDLVGADTLLSMGYCYNATNNDEIYAGKPPAVGYDFFQGPIVPSPGDTAYVSGVAVPDYRNLPMTSFNKYINGTDPDSPVKSYNYMQGLQADGSPLVDPNTGQETKFFVTGDPVKGTGWLDDDAADRRLMLSSGPFTMNPGDVQEVVVGVIVAQGGDRLSSISLLKLYDNEAQKVFDANFLVPPDPPAPTVYAREYENAIDLTWSTDAVGWSDVNPGRWNVHHQGYMVYQGESVAGPWKRIATYDEDDSVAVLYEDVISEESDPPVIVRELRATGANTGLQHHLRLDKDNLLGGPLVNYKDYFFAVTSYAYDASNVVAYEVDGNLIGYVAPFYENNPNQAAITVSPSATTNTLDQAAEHVEGVSDGRVDIAYLIQDAITGHRYRVVFKDNADTNTNHDIPYVWDLIDVTTNTVLLADQLSQAEGLENPVITDGFVADVVGPPLAVKDVSWLDSDRWLSWIGAGLTGFNGGIGLASEFFGSTLAPADFNKTVEIRFTQDQANWSDTAVYRRDQGYAFGGIGKFPGSVWDVTDPDNPRRLNIAAVEDPRFGSADLQWNPSDNADTGGREYLFIMNSDYNGAVDYNDDNWAPGGSDALFAGWLRTRPGHTFLEADARMVIAANYINTPEDVFEFTTHKPGTGVGTTVDNDMNKIRVVPNPYLNQSAYELNQFDRVVRFTNLPNVAATIRIFTLGGELVRTILKEDARSAEAVWDLENDQQIPVASGIYVYHVDAPGIGTEVGKMIVFIEKERLNRF